MTPKIYYYSSALFLLLIIGGLFLALQNTYHLLFSVPVVVNEIPLVVERTPRASLDFSRIAHIALFGQLNAPVRAVPSSGEYRLQGIFWAQDENKRYAAIEAMAGKSTLYAQGMELSPGVSVLEIRQDEVILDRQGQQESLTLPHRGDENV